MIDPRTLITEEQLRRMLVGPTSGANAAELARKVYTQESVYTPLAESRRDPTCAERIADYMAGRSEDIRTLQDIAEMGADGAAMEDASEQLAEMPLSVEVIRHIKILLGTGGPADWLDAELDADNDIRTLEYHYADWFDHAQVYVERDTPLWRFAESFVEVAAYADTPNLY